MEKIPDPTTEEKKVDTSDLEFPDYDHYGRRIEEPTDKLGVNTELGLTNELGVNTELESAQKTKEKIDSIEQITDNIERSSQEVLRKTGSEEFKEGGGEQILSEKMSKINWEELAGSEYKSKIAQWESFTKGDRPLTIVAGGVLAGGALMALSGVAGLGAAAAGAYVAGISLLTPILAKWRVSANEKKLYKAKSDFEEYKQYYQYMQLTEITTHVEKYKQALSEVSDIFETLEDEGKILFLEELERNLKNDELYIKKINSLVDETLEQIRLVKSIKNVK